MKLKIVLAAVCGILATVFWLEGCSQSTPPVGPASEETLTIHVPVVGNVHSEFVGAAQNTMLYCISGSGKPVTGSFGPLSAAAVTNAMSFSVTLQGNASSYNLIALQINDASLGTPLAFGAAPFTSSSTSVELGPMESSCYSVTMDYGAEISFENPYGSDTYDVLCNETPDGASGLELDNPNFNSIEVTLPGTIAYMGNGNLVDFAFVPPSSSFQIGSGVSKGIALGNPSPAAPVSIASVKPKTVVTNFPVQTGDVYCVKMAAGGYAWLQITNPGNITDETPLSFVFRLNTTVPYCAYEQSQTDLSGDCYPSPD